MGLVIIEGVDQLINMSAGTLSRPTEVGKAVSDAISLAATLEKLLSETRTDLPMNSNCLVIQVGHWHLDVLAFHVVRARRCCAKSLAAPTDRATVYDVHWIAAGFHESGKLPDTIQITTVAYQIYAELFGSPQMDRS